MSIERDLMELLPQELQNDPRAFDCRGGGMASWEREVCLYLLRKRYESKSFTTVDGDSFGPLVRGARLRAFGEQEWHLYTYG